jgi:glucosamine--fructose-6-phosphate aminotransferase (isomerizing)
VSILKTLMENEILEQAVALPEILRKNAAVFRNLAHALSKRQFPFIVIAARGTSDNAAVYGKYAIEANTGIPVALAAPSVSTVYNKPYRVENALVVGISQSGEAADVLSVITDGNKNGALTVSITNNASSALAEKAHFHLDCGVGPELSVAATKTFTAELLILAKLTLLLAQDDVFDHRMNGFAEDLRKCVRLKDEIFQLAQRYSEMNSCFTLSRGYDYCIALESALKLQECASVRAHAFSLADFMHGPISLVENNLPCLLFCKKGAFENEYKGLIDKLIGLRANVIVMTDDTGLKGLTENVVLVPQPTWAALSPIYFACAAQLFACGLALSKGLNPDKPRNLQKVTVTR